MSWSVREAQLAWERGPQAHEDWRMLRRGPPAPDSLSVVAELRPGCAPEELLEWLEAQLPNSWAELWTSLPGAGRWWVQLSVPYEDLATLASWRCVTRLREPHRARPREVTTEGYEAMFQQDWHAQGATGRRVDVAVLDVGFSGYEQLLGTELPSSVQTSFLSAAGVDAHGSAVAEIVHDVAPRADLTLMSFSTDVEYLAAIDELGESRVELVNGSVGFDNLWHADGSSPYTQAVDALVTQRDILYLAASGNENERYRVGALTAAGSDEVAIGGQSPVWVASQGGWVDVSLRWSEPMGGSGTDLDLEVYDETGNLCGRGLNRQAGSDDPYESVSCHAGSSWAAVYVVANSHDPAGLTGFLYSYYGLDEADASGERNLTLPGDTVDGLSVGAVDLPDLQSVAWYSSRGPTDDGRSRPHLVGPAAVSTSSYVGSFSGTSAAVPHVTGAAALVLGADKRRMGPAELRDFLVDSTFDIGPAGADEESGAGFLLLSDIPWRGCHCSHGGAPGARHLLLGLLLAPWALLSRRRRG